MSAQRTITAAVLVPLVVVALLFLSTPYIAAIGAALFLLGLWEWSRLVGIAEPLRRATYVMANIALMAALAWGGWRLFGVVTFVGAIWWLFATWWLAHYDFARNASRWSRTLKLGAGTLSIIPAWCGLVQLHYNNGGANGPRWALLALAMVWAADSFAYMAGMRWGRRKLIPQISPGKTWVGLWGGVIGAVAVGLIGATWVGVKPVQLPLMAILALATVTASVVGDLFESLMKRHSGFKDSGTLIPGHGGVLDRIDSMLAALPVLWVVKGCLNL